MDTLSHPDLPFEIETDPVTGRSYRRDIASKTVQPTSDIELLLMHVLCKLSDLEKKMTTAQPQKKEVFEAPKEAECTDDFCPTPEPQNKSSKRKS